MFVKLTTKPGRDTGPATDPVAMLLACHVRIRDHLALAKRLVDAVEPSPDEVTEAAAALLRYFGQALPLHILDEDVTLREALMMGQPLADEAVRAITTMTAEHSVIEPMIDEAMKQWRPLTEQPHLLPQLRQELTRDTLRLSTLLEAHLSAEEKQIFPLIHKLLTEDERTELARRMRERRQAG